MRRRKRGSPAGGWSDEAGDGRHGIAVLTPASRSAVAAVGLVGGGYAARVEAEQPAIRDGGAVGVAGEIGEHRRGPGEGRLGVDKPVLPPERCEMRGEGLATTQARDLAEERQPV